ncbi:hypothetical protein KQ51_01297 [Candidatus Izimaplasma bacterium HR1]|uniref:NifB/NifX family molybdenum-iron cluster-binding protein n=1 Tax=Candidatus Izimoplasma sp. HR1 TaxID=1541959 RepID=UPI0004F890BA|nr:hypothetical protein KQ51_01297 [Candidatus Izimaplasma bacterium HR1]
MPSRKKRYARRLSSERLLKPVGIEASKIERNMLNLDEFEALRLVDYEGLSQIEAADDMQVSRATIQRLLQTGRKKIIEAILLNKAIEVKNDIKDIKLKGENKMNTQEKNTKIIAFPTSDRITVDGHFGHTKEFALYTVEGNNVKTVNFVTPPPHEPGVLPRFLGEQGIDIIVTGGMGQMAVNLFNQQNIDVILGAKGSIELNLNEYLGGALQSTGSSCDHNHGDNHEC